MHTCLRRCYATLGATGAETILLLTAFNSPHPIHAADGHCTRNSSCITLLWLHYNHKMSISYHKNWLVSSHQSVGRGLFFMCFVVRIFWRNYLAINNLLVSVSRWNLWLEPFCFHVNCVHFLGVVFVHVGPAELCLENLYFVLHVQCCGSCIVSTEYSTAVHVCDCICSGV